MKEMYYVIGVVTFKDTYTKIIVILKSYTSIKY